MRPAILAATIRSLHPDLIDYISRVSAAGGVVLQSKLDTLNAAIQNAYRDGGLRSPSGNHAIRYCLLLNATTGFTGCDVPLWKPASVGNATLNGYVSGDLSSQGLLGNGSSKWINTGFIPSEQLDSVNSQSLFLYMPDISVRSALPDEGCGCRTDTTQRFQIRWGNPNNIYTEIGTSEVALASGTFTGSTFLITNRNAANSLRLSRNGTLIAQATTTITGAGLATQPVGFGARVGANTLISDYSNERITLAGMGTGLTASQETALNTFVQSLV